MNPWILAARPKTLWASVAPVAMGTAMAYRDGHFDPLVLALTLGGALLIQVGTNYCNDYADFAKGTDTGERQGPLRATQAGLVTPAAMKRATVMVFALAALVALALMARGGWPVAVIGVLSIASGILYTAGPKPLGYVGLGDLFTLVFFGPVAVAGTYYLQALSVPARTVVAGMGPGLLSVAILTVNNLRDREGDARTGKRTLAVRFGANFARWEYTVCIVAAGLVPIYLVGRYGAPANSAVAAMIILAAVPALRAVWGRSEAASLNRVLAFTALLLLAYALMFSIGWML